MPGKYDSYDSYKVIVYFSRRSVYDLLVDRLGSGQYVGWRENTAAASLMASLCIEIHAWSSDQALRIAKEYFEEDFLTKPDLRHGDGLYSEFLWSCIASGASPLERAALIVQEISR